MPDLKFQERDLFDDMLSSQKHITDGYNTFANECSTANVRDEFMRMLNEEHAIQAEVFDEMKKQGWYTTPAAEQDKIQQAKTKFENAKP